MYTTDFMRLARSAGAVTPPDDDAISRFEPQELDFETAVEMAGLRGHDDALRRIMDPTGAVIWEEFEIARFARLMPSLATLDRIGPPEAPDFVYRFVGDSINAVAKRNLRGIRLSEILSGDGRIPILQAYRRTVVETRPHAGAGSVEVSDMTWVKYLRFLYPVRVSDAVDRVLLIMLFSKD